ncbi:MAG: aldehyde reductase [Planctomycetes bacterium GWF2_41_51]|nr:MAG: aldehyde reductase [Planctomycetes bacterium GWF2_41_51]HBG28511.1 NADH-dependent alcohol dehydrogenase [Phycisphaerales bacterium]
MHNFTFHNPVKIVFGKDTIPQLNQLIDKKAKVLLTYGGGSIKKNGIYKQVKSALKKRKIVEFGGIEPNPAYETCIKAIELGRKEKVDFVLAVGGGSVLDGSKFIAAGIPFRGKDTWQIVCTGGASVKSALPLGTVLTLPATGSEMNTFAVISKLSTKEKLAFGTPLCYPQFSILDPQTTYSLDKKQLRNGIVDTFVHVSEQYATKDLNTPLQDRFAEGIYKTLINIAPAVMNGKKDYDSRASFMWCATLALNGLINRGVQEDWSTHCIGHEMTEFFGLAHAETLAIVMPAVWKYELKNKADKLAMLAENVWGVKKGTKQQKAVAAIDRTIKFFNSIGMPTSLKDYNLTPADCDMVVNRAAQRGWKIGENSDINAKALEKIFKLCF